MVPGFVERVWRGHYQLKCCVGPDVQVAFKECQMRLVMLGKFFGTEHEQR